MRKDAKNTMKSSEVIDKSQKKILYWAKTLKFYSLLCLFFKFLKNIPPISIFFSFLSRNGFLATLLTFSIE